MIPSCCYSVIILPHTDITLSYLQYSIKCPASLKGRYVAIQHTRNANIHICEVEVYGSPVLTPLLGSPRAMSLWSADSSAKLEIIARGMPVVVQTQPPVPSPPPGPSINLIGEGQWCGSGVVHEATMSGLEGKMTTHLPQPILLMLC